MEENRNRPWHAAAVVKGRRVYLGQYATQEEAAAAVKNASTRQGRLCLAGDYDCPNCARYRFWLLCVGGWVLLGMALVSGAVLLSR